MIARRPDDGITEIIIGEAIAIHRKFGPGLLESAYEALLAHALELRGLLVERQVPVSIRYLGLTIPRAYKIDLLVERAVVVETKSLEKSAPVHSSQMTTHVRLGGYRSGLLLNFGMATLRDGLKRVVNDYTNDEGSPAVLPGEPPSSPQEANS
jgi:GxxExxY protein